MKRSLLVLICLLLLATASRAADAPSFVGEKLRWEIHYAGVTAGTAWATARAEGAALVFEGAARNSRWYGALYSIDDHVRSTWVPGQGSVRYETRFREGDFNQDQDMQFSSGQVSVLRHQLIKGAWKTWTRTYKVTPGAEDPVSAMYAVRRATGAGPWTWPLFSGRKTWPLVGTARGTQQLETLFGEIPVDVVDLRMAHKGEVEQRGRFAVYLSQDAARLPVRAEIFSNVGTIRASLVGYRAPDGRVWGEVDDPG